MRTITKTQQQSVAATDIFPTQTELAELVCWYLNILLHDTIVVIEHDTDKERFME